jgi:hypoxanthine phosphoribosyltransferase
MIMHRNQYPELQEFISSSRISARVAELAGDLSPFLSGPETWIVMGVLRGALIFMADLLRCLARPVELDFIRISSYGANAASSGQIKLLYAPENDLRGRSVLLVEDIVDTGLSMAWLINFLTGLGVGRLKTCALLDKPACRHQAGIGADHVGFVVPPIFLVGYGLDWNQKFRYLPSIYHILLPTEDEGEAVNGNHLP